MSLSRLGLKKRQSTTLAHAVADQLASVQCFDYFYNDFNNTDDLFRLAVYNEVEVVIIENDKEPKIVNQLTFDENKKFTRQLYIFLEADSYSSVRTIEDDDNDFQATQFYRFMQAQDVDGCKDMTNFYAEFMTDLYKSKNINFQFVTIIPDGNCLFRAICDQMFGHQDEHSGFRRIACSFIRDNRNEFESIIEPIDQNEQTLDNFESFLEKMQQDGMWGGYECILALASFFNIKITVHFSLYESYSIPECGDRTTEFHLYLHNNHYSSLRPIFTVQKNYESQEIEEEFLPDEHEQTFSFRWRKD